MSKILSTVVRITNNVTIWLHWCADASASASKDSLHLFPILSPIDPVTISAGPLARARLYLSMLALKNLGSMGDKNGLDIGVSRCKLIINASLTM